MMFTRRLFSMVVPLACVFGLHAPVKARVVTPAKVRYETEQGKSKWYSVEVNLLTGSELNTATKQWSAYRFNKTYAVIFWDKDQASIIEISGIMVCGLEVSQSCLPLLGRMKGTDQDGDLWEICTAMVCGM